MDGRGEDARGAADAAPAARSVARAAAEHCDHSDGRRQGVQVQQTAQAALQARPHPRRAEHRCRACAAQLSASACMCFRARVTSD